MRIARLLLAIVASIGMAGAWLLFACAVMAVSLYIARLIPLTGRHRNK